MIFNVLLPKECNKCPYRRKVQRKFGETYHCVPEVSNMDVTHENGRSVFCPIARIYDFLKAEKEQGND